MPVSLSGPHGPASIQVVGGRVEQGLAVLVGHAAVKVCERVTHGGIDSTILIRIQAATVAAA